MKECKTCNIQKPFSEFYKKARISAYPDSLAGVSSDCKGCLKKKSINAHKNDPSKRKNNELKYHFNLTIEDFNSMFEQQGGCCAICGVHQSQLKKRLGVDHDHVRHSVRGLLCSTCNVGLGMFKNDPRSLGAAVDYVTFYSELADRQTNVERIVPLKESRGYLYR